MNIKILSAIVFALVLTLSTALALDVPAISAISGNTNAYASGSFIISNNDPATLSGIACSISANGWTSSVSCPSSLAANINQSVAFSVSIPQSTPAGSYSGSVNVSGWNVATRVEQIESFNIVVLPTGGITVVWNAAPGNFYQGENKTVIYNVSNNGNIPLNTNITLSSTIGLNSTESVLLNAGASVLRTINVITNSSTPVGVNSMSVTATGTSGSVSASNNVFSSFNVYYAYCELNTTASPIEIVEITNDNDVADETFYPLDTFDVRVKIQNEDDEESHKAVVSAVIVKGTEEVSDTDVEEKVRLSKNGKSTVTLHMKIPADIETGDHYVYVKVANDDDDSNCQQIAMKIKIKKSSHELKFDEIDYPENISCGSTVSVTGKIANIGSNDEEKVKVSFSDSFNNPQLKEINDFNEGDDSSLNFAIRVPQYTVSGKYEFNLTAYYGFEEDDDDSSIGTYDERLYMTYPINVYCGSQASSSNQSIITETSTAIIGLVSEVRIKLVNLGTTSQTYSLNAAADWAEINSVTPSSVTLSPGQEKEVSIKLAPAADTEIGAHTLVVTSQYGSQTESKNVPVIVQKASQSSSLIDKVTFYAKHNPTLVVIDAVLVLAIVIVIILLLSRKKEE